jgi:hypothetical protein
MFSRIVEEEGVRARSRRALSRATEGTLGEAKKLSRRPPSSADCRDGGPVDHRAAAFNAASDNAPN